MIAAFIGFSIRNIPALLLVLAFLIAALHTARLGALPAFRRARSDQIALELRKPA